MDPEFIDLELWDMFPHDSPIFNVEPELMKRKEKEQNAFFEKTIVLPYNKRKRNNISEAPRVFENIHGYMFVYDSSNKDTFHSAMALC